MLEGFPVLDFFQSKEYKNPRRTGKPSKNSSYRFLTSSMNATDTGVKNTYIAIRFKIWVLFFSFIPSPDFQCPALL